mmetsp:Transcript_14966/g.32076  ORF Transcript_14966/g.32076 Transcript_14966/m.32076 type:complete len:90 (-) Transcript_14966:101-370(-)
MYVASLTACVLEPQRTLTEPHTVDHQDRQSHNAVTTNFTSCHLCMTLLFTENRGREIDVATNGWQASKATNPPKQQMVGRQAKPPTPKA